jgi:hypothetical protein
MATIMSILVYLLLSGWVFGRAFPISNGEISKNVAILDKRALPAMQTFLPFGDYTYHIELATDEETIDVGALAGYAKAAYDQISSRFQGVVLVSAMFIPKCCIVIVSKPRGAQDCIRVAREGQVNIPTWWNKVKGRTSNMVPSGRTLESLLSEQSPYVESLLHTEDHAITKGGLAIWRKGSPLTSTGQFPPGTLIATWGKALSSSRGGLTNPCDEGGNLDPDCSSILRQLNIQAVTR